MKIRDVPCSSSAKAPLLSLATSITTIARCRKNYDGIHARCRRIGPHSHAKPRIKPTGILTSILSATYCWFNRGIPLAWPSIQVNLIYVLKFIRSTALLIPRIWILPPERNRSGRSGTFSIATLDSLLGEGMGSPLARRERRHRYTQISARRELYIRAISVNVLTKQILLRYSSWLSMRVYYVIVWKTRQNIFIEICVTQ